VGNLGKEKAAPAQRGESYPLVEKSNCRYASGFCELVNEDITLTLRMDASVGKAIELTASHTLDAALMSVSLASDDPGPRAMRSLDASGRRWALPLSDTPSPLERIRVLISVAGSAYFADASTTFLQNKDAGE
jgi:hypothetical protein